MTRVVAGDRDRAAAVVVAMPAAGDRHDPAKHPGGNHRGGLP